MTATIPTHECGGAHIRSHVRHLAVVVAVSGRVDAANIDRLAERIRRFTLTKDRLVFDLSDVNSSAADAISLVCRIAEDCRVAEVDWAVVANQAVTDLLRSSDDTAAFPITDSMPEAIHYFADMINRRREVLLPLVRRTA